MLAAKNCLDLLNNFKNEIQSRIPIVDKLSFVKMLAGGIAGCTLIYGIKIWNSHRYFARRGIKTPKYSFIGGNLPELLKKTYTDTLKEWTEIYGKTYGYYEGNLPILVTSDLELIEEIFYKQFYNFTGRKKLPFAATDTGPNVNIFMASKNRWKRMRAIINPTFSPARLRELSFEMKKCVDRFVLHAGRNLDKEINISDLFDRMVMDVVWNAGYGIDIDFQSNPNYPFFLAATENFRYVADVHLTVRILMYFPELKPYLLKSIAWYTYYGKKISSKIGNPFFWLVQSINKVLTERLKRKIQRKDYVQMLVDAQSDDFVPDDSKSDYDKDYEPQSVEKKLTYNEVIMNLVLFLLAGFETTAVTLSHCAFILAKHPEEMAKLQTEIDSLETDNFDYDMVGKLEYMDLFIKEVQRMYPVSSNAVVRKCTQATKICGIEFEKDAHVAVDVLSLHYNPEYWGDVDPNIFYPMRFSQENKFSKLVYMPFGGGPRSCIGIRFALLEIKLTLARLLKSFDITAPETGLKELSCIEGLVRRPASGVKIVLKKRTFKE